MNTYFQSKQNFRENKIPTYIADALFRLFIDKSLHWMTVLSSIGESIDGISELVLSLIGDSLNSCSELASLAGVEVDGPVYKTQNGFKDRMQTF